jgi:hypothetical protein
MTGSLVVAIIVIVGFALTLTFALKATESSDPAGGSANSAQSALSGAEAQAARTSIVASCESAGGSSTQCACIGDQVAAAGYDTIAELSALRPQVELATRTGDISGLPAPLAAAYKGCVS